MIMSKKLYYLMHTIRASVTTLFLLFVFPLMLFGRAEFWSSATHSGVRAYRDLSDSVIYDQFARKGFAHKSLTPDPVQSGDTLVVDKTCLILVTPTERQVEFLKKNLGDDYGIVADDNSFYASETQDFFRNHSIEVIETRSAFLVFRGADIILNTKRYLDYAWLTIAYKAGKTPVLVDSADADSLLLRYFRK